MADIVTLSDILRPVIERELAELHAKAADLSPDDVESRAHDLLYYIVGKVRERLGFADDAIRWEKGNHSSEYGYVGKIRVFSLNWSLTRDAKDGPWILESTLPQLPRGHYASTDEAKDAARVKLRMFLGHFAESGARPSFA